MKGKCLFKYTNTIVETVGNNGLSLTDIKNISNKIEASYNKLLEKYSNKQLGYMDIIYDDLNKYYELMEHSKDFEYIIVIGMGGSILGTQMVYEGIKGVYYNEYSNKKVYFLDNSDPEKTSDIINLVDLNKTLIFVISKSGNTSETLANFYIIRNLLKNNVKNYNKNIVAIANDGTLRNIAKNENYMLFDVPKNVGGRFSVLSAVGLAPLSCMDIDIEMLMKGAREMDKLCKNDDIFKNPALMNAAIHYILYNNNGKTISVLMPYIERLHKFGMWYRQLWAESLGKDGKGQTPIVSVGAKDQHSQLQLYLDGPRDKIITFLKVNNFKQDLYIKDSNYLNNHTLSELINAEQEGSEAALTSKGVPNVSIILDELNEYTLGKLIFMYEMQTAFMGELLEINAFDQPAVEDGKKITRELLMGKSIEELTGFKSLNNRYIIEM
ncbi:glucose-6-phosphate isomerase [Methanothermococcus sp.]|uniref:glucose-6-phosphate isomerase n=1 Tax=Methanothermococcus sp. TaxID=2614238 RepID=UPI0025EDA4A4|nr:glucose-6-phosphate isomerase [Methanothermococcus sp.]